MGTGFGTLLGRARRMANRIMSNSMDEYEDDDE